MGGNQAIERLTAICRSKAVEVTETGIINWLNPFKRKKLIMEIVERFQMRVSVNTQVLAKEKTQKKFAPEEHI